MWGQARGVLKRKKGRRSWDGGPSGLLLKTPGQAEREVGRSLRLENLVGVYHFIVSERTVSVFFCSSFFPLSSFLFFFIGFAVGFMAIHFLSEILGLRSPALAIAIRAPNDSVCAVAEFKAFNLAAYSKTRGSRLDPSVEFYCPC
jgi:hypothetical protein